MILFAFWDLGASIKQAIFIAADGYLSKTHVIVIMLSNYLRNNFDDYPLWVIGG